MPATCRSSPIVSRPGTPIHFDATRRAKALDAIAPEAFASMHPDDADALGLKDGDRVLVESRRGQIRIVLKRTTRESRGAISIPFHFREAAANLLTLDELDPDAKIPEFKFCAVSVTLCDD
jgi:formate dehydrogenase major subunit